VSISLHPSLDDTAPVVRPSSPPSFEVRARLCEVEAALARQEQQLRELRKSEERYRAVARNLPKAAIALFDRDLRFVLVEGQAVMEGE
jgi:PAS domain-containing protein